MNNFNYSNLDFSKRNNDLLASNKLRLDRELANEQLAKDQAINPLNSGIAAATAFFTAGASLPMQIGSAATAAALAKRGQQDDLIGSAIQGLGAGKAFSSDLPVLLTKDASLNDKIGAIGNALTSLGNPQTAISSGSSIGLPEKIDTAMKLIQTGELKPNQITGLLSEIKGLAGFKQDASTESTIPENINPQQINMPNINQNINSQQTTTSVDPSNMSKNEMTRYLNQQKVQEQQKEQENKALETSALKLVPDIQLNVTKAKSAMPGTKQGIQSYKNFINSQLKIMQNIDTELKKTKPIMDLVTYLNSELKDLNTKEVGIENAEISREDRAIAKEAQNNFTMQLRSMQMANTAALNQQRLDYRKQKDEDKKIESRRLQIEKNMQKKEYIDSTTALDGLSLAIDMYKNDPKITKGLSAALSTFGVGKGSNFKGYIENAVDIVQRMRTGAAISKTEENLYKKLFIPNVMNDGQNTERKLSLLYTTLNNLKFKYENPETPMPTLAETAKSLGFSLNEVLPDKNYTKKVNKTGTTPIKPISTKKSKSDNDLILQMEAIRKGIK